ncbi:hypothetical protein TrRE_jg1183, partial [Triparma retinervis]
SHLIFQSVFDAALPAAPHGKCSLRSDPCPDGTMIESDTGRPLSSWSRGEASQLSLLRSENGSDVGNLLSRRIKSHADPTLAAKSNNIGALRTCYPQEGGVPGRGGSGPLHYAALHGSTDCARWLIGSGCSPNERNANGATPMHFAGGEGEILMAFGDLVYAPLIEMARDGDAQGVRGWMVENGGPGGMGVDGPEGWSGATALCHAASGGSLEVCRMLVEGGADVGRPREPRANAMHYATFKMHKGVFGYLKGVRGGREAKGRRGESQLWGSMGAVDCGELARWNVKEAERFVKACEDQGDEVEADT